MTGATHPCRGACHLCLASPLPVQASGNAVTDKCYFSGDVVKASFYCMIVMRCLKQVRTSQIEEFPGMKLCDVPMWIFFVVSLTCHCQLKSCLKENLSDFFRLTRMREGEGARKRYLLIMNLSVSELFHNCP